MTGEQKFEKLFILAQQIPEDRHVVPLLRLCVVQYGDTVYNNGEPSGEY